MASSSVPVFVRSLALPALLLAASAFGCNESPDVEDQAATDVPPPESFQQDRAFADLRHLCEDIGQRRIGTQGAAEARQWLRSELESHGWTVEEHPFEVTIPEGARRKGTTTGVNLLARREGTEPGEIWFASHYDTYDLPGFVGANDAGSSTALLVELGRVLGGEGPRRGKTLVLAFFDGEERFPPARWDDETNSTFGSRYEANRLKEEGRVQDVKGLILFDMVGDADLNLYFERSTDRRIRDAFERAAHRLGDPNLFVGSREIKDDHIPFHRVGVPVADLIDFTYGPGNRYWHTLDDSLEHVSAESLGRVGRVTLAALPELERVLGAPPKRR